MLTVIILYFIPFLVFNKCKCIGNCNNINDPFTKICVPDVVKDLNVKVFNLMSRTNGTTMNVNAMNHVILASIWVMKIVNEEKGL